MKKVMVRAWEIAKEGQSKFGGKVSEYLSEALKIAWAESKETEKTHEVVLDLNNDRLWIAEIVGTHPRYRLDRKFLNDYYVYRYFKVFDLKNGIYAAKFSNRGGQQFFQVKDGEAYDLTYDQVVAIANEMDNNDSAA